MTRRATAGLGAIAVLVAGPLAGCGDDEDSEDGAEQFADQSYEEIKEAALDAMGSLDSMHADLAFEGDGESAASDVSMSADGNCTGTVSIGEVRAEVLRVGGEGWYKPNRAFLEQVLPGRAEAAAEFVGDSWVVDSDDAQTGTNCDLEDFVASLSDDEAETDTEVVGVEQLDGQDVVRLEYTNGGRDGSAYILAEGEHYIVRIEFAGEQSGTARFSSFNEPVLTEPPAPDEVVDLTDFGA